MAREDIDKDLNINFSSDSNFKDEDSNSGLQDKSLSSKTSKDDSASEETNSANNRVTCVEKRNTIDANFTSDYKNNRNESSSTSGDTSSCITEDKRTSEGMNTTVSRYFPEKQKNQSQVIRVPEDKCATLHTRCVSNIEIDATKACSTLEEKSSKGKRSSTNEYNNGEICTSENEGSDNKISYFEEDNSVIESSYTEDNERDCYAPEDKCATTSVDKSLLKVVHCRSPTTTPSSIPEFESSTARSTTELTIIPVNETSYTLQNKSPVNEASYTLQNKSPVNEASCTRQNKSPVNEASYTLQNKSTACSTSTLNEANHTLDGRSSTVEVSCASQERSGTNLSCCVTEDVQSSPLICTTEEKRAIIQSSCISEVKNSSVHISIPKDNCVNLDSKGTVSDATCILEDDSADKEANYVSKNSRIINAAPEYKSVVYEAIFALVNKSVSKKTNYSEGKKITTVDTRFTSEDSGTATEAMFTSEDSSIINETSCALGDVILQNNHRMEVHKNAKPHPKEKSSLHQLERKTMACTKSQPFPNYSLGGADVVKHPAAVVKPSAAVVKPPAAGVKPPAAGLKPPAAGVKPPAAGVKPPAAGVEPPAAGVEPPAAGVKHPVVGLKPSAAGVKPPTAVVKPPAAVVKPEPVKMLTPFFVRKGSATPRPVTGCFSCKLCGITTTGNVNLKMHLQGAKHKKKLSQEIQKRRSEGVQLS